MSVTVTVVEYDIGNIRSVSMALEHCGAKVLLTDDPKKILEADRLVLPGVGAFAKGMANLEDKSLLEPLNDYAKTGRPFLGICLGMQMMFETSEEFGHTKGLGFIEGTVKAIPKTKADNERHKIPHIGWNGLRNPSNGASWDYTILEGVEPMAPVYFVHSYTAYPARPENRLADCDYNGRLISATVKQGNLYGCQFHPEKSGVAGLKIIHNFININ